MGNSNGNGLSKRDRETVRFLKWVIRYRGWWELICTPGDEHMNMDMMKMLIGRLTKEGFYEMIFVLLMVHREADFMKSMFDYLIWDMLLMEWQKDEQGKEQIIKNITGLLT